MNWYVAKIIYRIICGQGNHTPQFDEQLRLVSALDGEAAIQKAISIGERGQETFYNNQKQLIQWKFIGISELCPVPEFADGAELYSRINEVDNAEDYMHMVHQQARRLQDQFLSSYQDLIS